MLSPEAKEFVPRQPVDAATHDPAVTSVSAGDALVVPGDGLLGAGPPDLLGLPGYVTSCYPFQAREHRWVCCVFIECVGCRRRLPAQGLLQTFGYNAGGCAFINFIK